MIDIGKIVSGHLYRSDADSSRDRTVCQIISRDDPEDFGYGMEQTFIVRFADGFERTVLAQSLTPWYPLG